MSSFPGDDRPLVTILFLAYQQAQWARASAEACLAQTGGPYEIILSDDHSSDGTFEILQQVAADYRGPHRVVVRQSPQNVGIGRHYNDLVALAQGELLVTMAADDFSVPDRIVTRTKQWGRQEFERRSEAALDRFCLWAAGWLEPVHARGAHDVEAAFHDVRTGTSPPAQALLLSLV